MVMQLTDQDLLQMLRSQVAAAGSENRWAVAHNVPRQLVNMVLTGKRGMCIQIANAMGFYQLTVYVPTNGDKSNAA